MGAHNTPLEEATTPSLDALKAYSLAWKVSTSVGNTAAIPLMKRAIEIDPQFAMAHAMLSKYYFDIGELALSRESARQAFELRKRASDRERFFITTFYEMVVTGDLEKAEQICDAWAQTYPRDVESHAFLSGMILVVLGRYEKAVEEGKDQSRLIRTQASPITTSLSPMYLSAAFRTGRTHWFWPPNARLKSPTIWSTATR